MSQPEPSPPSNVPPQQPASPPPPKAGFNVSRILPTVILIAALMMIVFVGYLIVDTIMSGINQAASNIPDPIGQVQEILNPTPTIIADPVTVIREIRSLSRLETVSYTIEKVITAESGDEVFGFLFRDRLLLVAQGEVIAGVDLSRLDDSDIQIVGTTVFFTMPASEIFVATLDNDDTYVYDRQTAVFGQQVDLETLARQEAERVILEAALDDGILKTAQENAEQYLSGLFHVLGFEDVIFVTATPAPDQNRGD